MSPYTGDPQAQPLSTYATSLTGTCLCKSIRVTIHDTALFTQRRGHVCHCSNCRKVSGSWASVNLIIEDSKVSIEDREGTLKEYKDGETGSGRVLGRWFCSGCGNPIKSVNPALEGKSILKMGMFPRIPTPEFETFYSHRQDWEGEIEGVERYKLVLRGEKVEDATTES